MKKIILIASYVGRCGSSTIIRLFQKAGINIGNNKLIFRQADKHNPYGYYDAYPQEQLIWKMFPEYRQFPLGPPADVQLFLNRAQQQVALMMGFFKEYFDDQYPVAIKDIRYFFLAISSFLPAEYDVRTVVLHRPLARRLLSGYAMVDDGTAPITKEQMVQWATAWRNYEGEILSATPAMPKLHVRFDDLFDAPDLLLQRLSDFTEVVLPAQSIINPTMRHH